MDVDLKVPQTQSPFTPSPSELRTQRVVLPKGFSINPSAADGKIVCAGADTAIGTLGEAHCPEYSKVATLSLDVASLPAPIPGAVYIGEPKPGNRYRLVLAADGYATHLKLLGTARPDPQTGQLTVSFEELPQQPLQDINLHFFGSERGLLATPTQCGRYEVQGEFVPWDSELTTRHTTSYFTIDSGPNGTPCPNGPRPFSPSLQAGTANNTAGAHSPFSVVLRREDGEQNLTGLTVDTPPGFTATLKGVPYCPESAIAGLQSSSYSGLAEQAFPLCPAASRVGSVIAGAGAGTHPVYIEGKAYLAGPYKGAPLSLVVVVPAVSGPYDLGNVAVRVALHVDESTARISAVSDPLPQILEGIPLRTRYIQVNLDREGFALNPTDCEPMAVNAHVSGDEGATSDPAAHFQVANCEDLPFEPKISLRFTGATHRAGNPSLLTTIHTAEGEANFRRARVILPRHVLIDNEHIAGVCTRVQFAANNCPKSSRIGFARAETPLLEEPLAGPVYIRSSGQELPDLVADLNGQVHIVLVGHNDQVHERLRSTFTGLPDVPVGTFRLKLFGAKKGILENGNESLCARTRRAGVRLSGQNGAALKRNPRIAIAGCEKHKKKRARRKRTRHRSAMPGLRTARRAER